LLPLPKIHVIHFAMPFLFVVIGIRLIQMFVQALSRAESANQELEQRVAEKSSEIQ
jgi:two-component system sensor histidine kinase UhpB